VDPAVAAELRVLVALYEASRRELRVLVALYEASRRELP
jgi:hypothetical protein